MQVAVVWDRSGVLSVIKQVNSFRLSCLKPPPSTITFATNGLSFCLREIKAVAGIRASIRLLQWRLWRGLPRAPLGFITAAAGFRGCRDDDLKPPWRHREGQTAANLICPKAWPIFRGGQHTVICDVVRVILNVDDDLVIRPIKTPRDFGRDIGSWGAPMRAGVKDLRSWEAWHGFLRLREQRMLKAAFPTEQVASCVCSRRRILPGEASKGERPPRHGTLASFAAFRYQNFQSVAFWVLRFSKPLVLVRQYRSGN